MTAVVDYLDRLFKDRPEKLTPAEAADILGITTQGIYGWLKDGVIPAYKVGKSWIILRDELEETVRAGANRRHHPPSPAADQNRPDGQAEGEVTEED